jgi:hypothetical protein
MSAPPRTVIQHTAATLAGRTLLFRLPPGIRSSRPGRLLAHLTDSRWTRTDTEAEAELRRRVNECAARLPLPPAVLVAGHGSEAEPVDDLLVVYTVLAKSSDRVYLRDKEPNLARIHPERRVVLQLPGINKDKR